MAMTPCRVPARSRIRFTDGHGLEKRFDASGALWVRTNSVEAERHSTQLPCRQSRPDRGGYVLKRRKGCICEQTDEIAHDGDKGDLLWLGIGDQALAAGRADGFPAAGGEGDQIQHRHGSGCDRGAVRSPWYWARVRTCGLSARRDAGSIAYMKQASTARG